MDLSAKLGDREGRGAVAAADIEHSSAAGESGVIK